MLRLIGETSFNGIVIPDDVPRLRQVFAVLALSAPRSVDVSTCYEELWEQAPPKSHKTALRTCIMQLRRRGVEIQAYHARTTRTHYGLNKNRQEVDALWFIDRMADLREVARTGYNLGALAEELEATLAITERPFLEGLECGPVLKRWSLRIEACRNEAQRWRFAALLRLGRHHEVVDELLAIWGLDPVREDIAAMLMLAQYRCERRHDIPRTFQDTVVALKERLGMGPGPHLNALYQSVLRGDPLLLKWDIMTETFLA